MRTPESSRAPRDADPGPSTNDEPVPDGLEGSIMEDGNDRGRGRPDGKAAGSGATSKQQGDREEGRDRTVHEL